MAAEEVLRVFRFRVSKFRVSSRAAESRGSRDSRGTVLGYIPEDAEWYIAELVMEITVQGAQCNVVHQDAILIHAHSPEEAFKKAMRAGSDGEMEYDNPKGQLVEIRFRGIASLDVIHDKLVDGAELYFKEHLAISESEIQKMISSKDKLAVFSDAGSRAVGDPDYASKEIADEVARMLKKNR